MAVKRLLTVKQKEVLANVKASFINGLTVSQIDTYINNQITDLISAKAYLKKLSKVVLYLLKKTNLQ